MNVESISNQNGAPRDTASAVIASPNILLRTHPMPPKDTGWPHDIVPRLKSLSGQPIGNGRMLCSIVLIVFPMSGSPLDCVEFAPSLVRGRDELARILHHLLPQGGIVPQGAAHCYRIGVQEDDDQTSYGERYPL